MTVSMNCIKGSDPLASLIAPGQVLMVKRTVHSLKSGTPGMMGVDGVVLTFERGQEKPGTVIRLADR